MVKATYGTGAFLLLNTGATPAPSRNRLLTTVAYQWRGKRTYALEGSIFSAGATVQWLRDGLKVIAAAPEAGERAARVASTGGVYLVPAFAGLGAPYWSSDARALLSGVTRGTSGDAIIRAALESVGYQTRELIAAMTADAGAATGVIRADGGMAASDFTMQFVSDMLGVPVDRPAYLESTALGAAFAAGWQAGVTPGPESFSERRRCDRVFAPAMDEATRDALYRGWREAVKRAL
jgi:glycerol kinase